MYFIAERLGQSVVAVERMSRREVQGWIAWFSEANKPPTPDDDAVAPQALSKAELRRMFS